MRTAAAKPTAARTSIGEPGVRVLPTLREWETRTFDGICLSTGDRLLVKKLAGSGESRIQIDELRDGLRVRARSWVGVLRLESLELRIEPKLTRDHAGLVRLLEFTLGMDGLCPLEMRTEIETAGDSLLDLIGLLFAKAAEDVVRRGLMADYVELEEELGMIRGRILADRQILQRFGRLDRINCRFDELEHDIDENRLLAAALRVAARRIQKPALRRRLARLRAVLESICDPSGLDLRTLRTGITYNRLNLHYERAHALAWLVLDGFGIEDILAVGSTRSFSFLLDMNRLFERFVERLVGESIDHHRCRVDARVVHASIIWDRASQKPYSRVIPDLVVRSLGPEGKRLAIDAKYKLYDQRRIAPSDIYQTFLYAYALASGGTHSSPTALLLYPASSMESPLTRLEVRSLYRGRGAEIIGMAIPVPSTLDELKMKTDGPIKSKLRETINWALAP